MNRPLLLLVGGVGRMADVYRDAADSLGFDLLHIERGLLPPTPPRVARVIVVASVVSHPLREAAGRVAAAQRVPISFLRTPSVSSLRRALTFVAREAREERHG